MNQLVMERTGRTGAPARRGAAERTGRPAGTTTVVPGRTHEWRTLAAVAVAVLVVVLVATWSFAQGWGRGPVVGPGELAVDGGLVRVDGVVSAARPQHAMPGMGTDEDPVAEGERRVSVDVTLMAGTGTMEFSAERFGLRVDGTEVAHLAHRDVLPGEALPAGTQLSGTILFDVPADATTATLTYDGAGSADVVLPAEAEQVSGPAPAEDPTTGAGHGAGHAEGTTPSDASDASVADDPAGAGE